MSAVISINDKTGPILLRALLKQGADDHERIADLEQRAVVARDALERAHKVAGDAQAELVRMRNAVEDARVSKVVPLPLRSAINDLLTFVMGRGDIGINGRAKVQAVADEMARCT